MLQLKLVKTTSEDFDNSMPEDAQGMLHGTMVVKKLIEPWIYSGRIICGDSYLCISWLCRKDGRDWYEINWSGENCNKKIF